jgi:hypothetical protein
MAALIKTSNWIVAHLNKTTELSTPSKQYDLKSFDAAILSAEDHSFVRIKTRSGKFIVPVQVSGIDLAHAHRRHLLPRPWRRRPTVEWGGCANLPVGTTMPPPNTESAQSAVMRGSPRQQPT